MKVQTNKTPVGFTPITTSITFETQEEFNTFKTLMWHNASAPNAVRENRNGVFNPNLCSLLMAQVEKNMSSCS